MTFASPPRPAPGASRPPGRRRGALGPTIVVLVVLGILFMITANLWTEVLWYDALGYVEVIQVTWVTRGLLFLAGFLVMAAAVYAALAVAYRSRPVYAPSTPEQASLDQYREMIEPLRKLVMIAAPLVLGFFAGTAASAQWETVQLFLNGVEVGQADPQFGMDISFFMFTLPALRFVVSFLMAVAIIAGIAGVATQYLYGGLRLGGGGDMTTRAARVQIGVTAAVVMLLIAANYWLDRYSLLTSSNPQGGDLPVVRAGASYADVNAVMPARAILAGVAVLVAVLFLVAAVRGTWRLPAIGVGLMVVSAIAVGAVYPSIVQRFQVEPNAQALEAEFIQRNIDATRAAFGIDDVEVTPYNATLVAERGALREDAETTASIRLLDPAIVSPSFRQLQQNKQYYNFPDTLSVDRYTIDGESRDTVIAVRELNLAGLGADQRSWVNDHTVFTHGFGVVAAYGNTTAADGRPAFYQGGIPSEGSLGTYEPRIYFGQSSPSYSIVGAPEGTEPWELDFPDDDAPSGQVNTTFPTQEVQAGPSIGNLWNQLLFAVKFGSEQILFSDRVTSESQILFDRDPRERVGKVAPYLTLDTRVYPAVVDERIVWIVDGYTTSDQYPYSSSRALEEVTTDALTMQSNAIAALAPQQVNYVRNSVKATVDAYSGEVTLYAWDEEDPVLQTWQGIFPTKVAPISEVSGDLMSHLRYPEDLFKVQRNLLAEYHVDTAAEFYSGQDFWRNPQDPVTEGLQQPPYYLTLQMPTQDEPTFSLTSTFIPGGQTDRNVLTGFLAVDAEPGNEPGERRDGYGQLRLLELPRNTTVPGPGQVQNAFRSNPEVSQSLNVLQLGNSSVVSGNLLTLPVGGGLLYVQPVYVQASEGTRFPLLQRVLVAFGEEIGFAETLEEALDQVFQGDAGVEGVEPGADVEDVPDAPVEGETPDDVVDGVEVTPTEPEETPDQDVTPDPAETEAPQPTTPAADGTPQARLDAALAEARDALVAGQEALADGDFAAYGAAQERLEAAVSAAIAAQEEMGG
ncbi:UPF0182 family membrane protein [Cellulomonas bogoriensis]|uniref:UPF0182 protein N869_16530 n=1 Tax=Cellulomonas bogoriensis 69B4 = DSM 16987 TaxID=1386082 RepID=A0A0A0BX99_9CELL|nr:UPF0182 family protein [Cellulomonas bogoriensis]KGM13038.1 membrane protein [Cellulomonas bogoriensis 69B4 = DSM 16987]